MAPPTNMSQTPAHTVDCSIPDCRKQKVGGYKTKKGLTDHMLRWHQAAVDVLSPITATARTLFHSGYKETEPSAQGNSAGQVNSPKVMTEGRFQCGVCGQEVDTNERMMMHVKTHNNPIVEEPENAIAEGENTAKEIENLVTVDKLVDAFVDMAFRTMRPNEAPETTKMEDKYNLLFRQHQKLVDKNVVLTKANENRLEDMKQMEKLRTVATSSLEDLQETKKANQILEECMKMKDTEVEAMWGNNKRLKKESGRGCVKSYRTGQEHKSYGRGAWSLG